MGSLSTLLLCVQSIPKTEHEGRTTVSCNSKLQQHLFPCQGRGRGGQGGCVTESIRVYEVDCIVGWGNSCSYFSLWDVFDT